MLCVCLSSEARISNSCEITGKQLLFLFFLSFSSSSDEVVCHIQHLDSASQWPELHMSVLKS